MFLCSICHSLEIPTENIHSGKAIGLFIDNETWLEGFNSMFI